MLASPEEIQAELENVVSKQSKELTDKLDELSQKSLKRVIKALTGVINDNTQLNKLEQQFIERVFQAQENFLALKGLTDEQLTKEE